MAAAAVSIALRAHAAFSHSPPQLLDSAAGCQDMTWSRLAAATRSAQPISPGVPCAAGVVLGSGQADQFVHYFFSNMAWVLCRLSVRARISIPATLLGFCSISSPSFALAQFLPRLAFTASRATFNISIPTLQWNDTLLPSSRAFSVLKLGMEPFCFVFRCLLVESLEGKSSP